MTSTTASSTKPSFALGIDFGTTFCCVAVLRHPTKKPKVLPSSYSTNTTPSYVAYNADSDSDEHSDDDNGGIFAGEAAKQEAHENPEKTIFDIKRLIGRSFYDPNIQKYKELWPFHLVNMAGQVGVKIEDQEKLPQLIATELIRHLKRTSEDFLGGPVDSAVVTIPVYYNQMQKGLTKWACEAAGLTNVEFITEPVAAAVAYGLKSSTESHEMKTCLIYDLGGGTFDVTIFRLDSQNRVEVKATGGDDHLGGEDFNDLITQFCIEEFKRIHGVDLAEGKTSEDAEVRKKTAKKLRRLRNECERQKCFLASVTSVVVSLDSMHEAIDLLVTVTRSMFEDSIAALLHRSIKILGKSIKESGYKKEEIQDVILIGGSSRIPKVQQLVQEYFDGKQIRRSIDADVAVASGAAVHAYNIFKKGGTPLSVVTLIETTHDELHTFESDPSLQVPTAAVLPKTFRWTTKILGFPPRSLHAAVALGHNVFAFGGWNGDDDPSYLRQGPLDIFLLNVSEPETGWRKLAIEKSEVNPNQRYGHSAVAHKGKVIIFGGRDTQKNKHSNSTYFLDTQTLKWDKPKVSGDIPKPRYHHTAVLSRNQLLVFGGSGNGVTKDLHCLDLNYFIWSTVETKGMSPSRRSHHSATVYKDRFMLIFGGYDYDCEGRQEVNSTMSFDLNTKTWSLSDASGTPPPTRVYHSAFMENGRMYIFGGSCGTSYVNDLFSSDPDTLEWRKVTPAGPTPPPRINAASVCLKDQVIIFGGFNPDEGYLGDTCVLDI